VNKKPVLSFTTPHTAYKTVNPLNTKLNPICHLLALLGAHHILHVSGLRVKSILHVHSIGEHDEQKVLDVELVVIDLKHKVSTTKL